MSNENSDLLKKYPKMALQGKRVQLDAAWKRNFVAFEVMAILNVKLSMEESIFSKQLSEAFHQSLGDESPIELTEQNLKELKMLFRIKNALRSSYMSLYPFVKGLDSEIRRAKPGASGEDPKNGGRKPEEVMDEVLFNYYVGTSAGMFSVLEQKMKLANDLDITIRKCFAEAIKKGTDIEALEAEALSGIDTRGKLKEIQTRVCQSLGIEEIP